MPREVALGGLRPCCSARAKCRARVARPALPRGIATKWNRRSALTARSEGQQEAIGHVMIFERSALHLEPLEHGGPAVDEQLLLEETARYG